MHTSQKNLYQILLENNEQFYCPPIQRLYVWDKKKREELYADLYALTQGEKYHFFGTLIVSSPEDVEIELEGQTEQYRRRMIIDGQQRLTSLFLLLIAANQLLGSMNSRALSVVKKQVADCANTAYAEIPKLLPTIADQAELLEVLKGTASNKREIGRAASQFKQELESLQTPEALRGLLHAVLHNTTFVVVELSKEEDPCAYFAAANGRGVPLNPTDLIKNLLLMKSGEKDLDVASKQYWEPIEDAVGGARLRQLTLAMHDVLHGWGPRSLVYRNLAEDLRKQGAEPFFNELKLLADAFCWLDRSIYMTEKLSKNVLDASERATRFKKFLPEGVQFMWMYPVTLYLQKQVNAQQLEQCLNFVENYAIRMFGNFGSTLRDVSARIAALRKKELSGEDFVGCFFDALAGHSAYKDRGDEELQRFIKQLRVRKGADEQWIRACLLGLEALNRPSSTPVQPSLEHILPKRWISSPMWNKTFDRADDGDIQYRVGNLTILGLSDNSDVGRASFTEKKEFMQRSPLLINENIAKLSAWTKEEILSRTDSLASDICRAWPQRRV